MAHDKSSAELIKSLEEIKKIISVGQYYAHYKHLETKYQVVDVGMWENTEETCVMYKSLDTGITWVRTVENFLEEVEVEGKKVPRFKLM